MTTRNKRTDFMIKHTTFVRFHACTEIVFRMNCMTNPKFPNNLIYALYTFICVG